MEIKPKKKETIKSIDKALNLLEFLSKNRNEIGIAEISEKMNMGLSTVHRILNTLKYRGYILQNQKTAKYRLGMKLFELGCEVRGTKNLIKTIRPYLRKLSKITNETANLAILEDKEVIYLDTIESSETLRTEIIQGSRTPAHCTALGKTLLAFLDDYDFEQLYGSNGNIISITPQSISSLEDLKKELKKVKEQGYALDREESMIGINCIGVPIFNKDREAIAAISITGPASRFTLDKMENTKEQLFNISKEISNSFYES
jgi:IclR family transcriptional regulator, KDG regulon repressor